MSLPPALTTFSKQPLLHFLLLAGFVGGLQLWYSGNQAEVGQTTLRVTAAEISQLEAEWTSRYGRPPMDEEIDGLVDQRVRETALYRRALEMGLDQDDQVLRRVLVQKLETLVRGLVEVSLSPTDQDLETYYAENAERYRPPPLVTFVHVFFDPDRRDETTLDDAATALLELQTLGEPPDDMIRFGDRFMLQSYYPEKDEQRVASLFGREFARSVFELEPQQWHGPVLSGYGTHLVYVAGRREFSPPELTEIRDSLAADWVASRLKEISDDYFADILASYEIVVEREPSDEALVEVDPT